VADKITQVILTMALIPSESSEVTRNGPSLQEGQSRPVAPAGAFCSH